MLKIRRRRIRWALAFGLVLITVFFAVGSAQAIEIVEEGIISEGEVIEDDVFIAGDNVVVNGTVRGDLIAFGQSVTVNGKVEGSLITGAQTVEVNGEVAGSVYGGAYALVLGPSAEVGRNVYFGGFSLEAQPGSQVGRDLLMGGYQAFLSGEVERDVRAGVGALEISGRVGRDVVAEVGEPGGVAPTPTYGPPGVSRIVSSGLRVSRDAEIGGRLTYTSPEEQASAIQARPGGGVVYKTPAPARGRVVEEPGMQIARLIGAWILARIRQLVTLLILGGLAIWLVPDLLNQVAEKARSQPLPAAGWGLVSLIVGYVGAGVIAIVILIVGIFLGLITLGGLAGSVFGLGFSLLGLAFTAFVLLVSYGSKLVVAFLIGRWILASAAPRSAEGNGWPLVVGVVIYVVLRAIPFLGWLFGLVVTLIGLGAMWLRFREWRTPEGAESATA